MQVRRQVWGHGLHACMRLGSRTASSQMASHQMNQVGTTIKQRHAHPSAAASDRMEWCRRASASSRRFTSPSAASKALRLLASRPVLSRRAAGRGGWGRAGEVGGWEWRERQGSVPLWQGAAGFSTAAS